MEAWKLKFFENVGKILVSQYFLSVYSESFPFEDSLKFQ